MSFYAYFNKKVTTKNYIKIKYILFTFISIAILTFIILLIIKLITDLDNSTIKTSTDEGFLKFIERVFRKESTSIFFAVIITFSALLASVQILFDNISEKVTINKTDEILSNLQRKILSSRSHRYKFYNQNTRHSSTDQKENINKQAATINRLTAILSNNDKNKKPDFESKEYTTYLITDEFQTSRNRLLKEIERLESRGLLNLVIGIITTLSAITVLLISIIYTPETSDIESTAKYFIPKFTFSLFVEVFSFFFLRLYRSSLIDIKYYQNELTNIDMKSVALKVLSCQENKETLSQACIDLSKTERNFILKDSEGLNTTVISKNETASDKHFSDLAQYIVDKFKAGDKDKKE